MTALEWLAVLLLFALVQSVLLYLVIKAAVVGAFREALALVGGRSRQKGAVTSLRNDFRAAARWAKALDDEQERMPRQ